MKKNRCSWVNLNNPLYVKYHDNEWSIPVHLENKLFEMLILEGAQAGLTWETILLKRQGYLTAFKNFDLINVANLKDNYLEKLLDNPEIIRNRLKVYSTRQNARVFLSIQKQYGSFDSYIWKYVNYKPIVNSWKKLSDIPNKTKISEAISKDLKKLGMNFVGPTIIYAYMQAIGMVNDHTIDCCWHPTNKSTKLIKSFVDK